MGLLPISGVCESATSHVRERRDSHYPYLHQVPVTMLCHLSERTVSGATMMVLLSRSAASNGSVPWMRIWLDAVNQSLSAVEREGRMN